LITPLFDISILRSISEDLKVETLTSVHDF
jgi:hypothetical protein